VLERTIARVQDQEGQIVGVVGEAGVGKSRLCYEFIQQCRTRHIKVYEAQAAALIGYGGALAAIAHAVSVTTKTTHEAYGIPTPQANAEGLRMTRAAIYLARHVRLDGLPAFEREKDLIRREVRAIVDRVLELGDGDAALGSVRAFESGVLDIPWSPNRGVKSRVLPARDIDGYLRIVDPGLMPFPREVLEVHEDGLRRRAERDRIAYGPDLAVASVYEISEPVGTLLPDRPR